MKKYIALLLACCAVFMLTGCAKESTPAPATPSVSPDMMTPDVIMGDTNVPGDVESMPEADLTPEGDAGIGGAVNGEISGFEEGKQVTEADAPEVTSAVKEKYPDAKITGITMSTHEGKQVYHVMLEGAENTTDIYVDTEGNIIPYVAGTDTTVTE